MIIRCKDMLVEDLIGELHSLNIASLYSNHSLLQGTKLRIEYKVQPVQ